MKTIRLVASILLVAILAFVAGYEWPREAPAVRSSNVAEKSVGSKPLRLAASMPVSPIPKVSVGALLGQNDREQRLVKAAELLSHASSSAELAAMLAEVTAAKASKAATEMESMILVRWGEVAPEDALMAVAARPARQRERAENDVFTGWIVTEPTDAWNWALQHPASFMGPSRGDPMPQVRRLFFAIQTLVQADRGDEVRVLVSKSADQKLNGTLAQVYVSAAAKYDLPAMQAWVSQLPDGPMRAAATLTLSAVSQ